MDEKIEKIVNLIKSSPLDETIQGILIRDLQNDGLNDFIREQIKAYCVEGLKEIDEAKQEAIRLLEQKDQQTPSM